MSQNHTPGPWITDGQRNFPRDVYVTDDSGKDELLATAYEMADRGDAEDCPIACANARLIAAAPELLNRLREITNVAADICAAFLDVAGTESEPGWVADLREALNDGRDAIAKAEGRS